MRTVMLLAAIWMTAGCVSVPKGLTVELGNSSGQPVSNISVKSDDQQAYSLPAMDVHESKVFTPPLEGLPSQLQLEWEDSQGRQHQSRFNVAERLPSDYKGSIHLQINDNNQMQVFVKPWNGGQAGNQPWARVEDWEGTTSIPGLSGR